MQPDQESGARMRLRRPRPPLRPFVRLLWASSPQQPRTPRELMLPNGSAHIAIRTSDTPVRLFADPHDAVGHSFSSAVVSGPRSRAYSKDVSVACGSVGAQLLPGAGQLLCADDSSVLAEMHVPLDAIWNQATGDLVERIREASDPNRRMDLLESFLLARLPRARGVHPAIAHSLERLTWDGRIGEAVRESGYSHRRFLTLFQREVGLAPKRFCRVARFQRAVRLLAQGSSLIDTALGAGYADQAHFGREFRSLSGITPGEYLRAAPLHRNHVPIPHVQFRSRRR